MTPPAEPIMKDGKPIRPIEEAAKADLHVHLNGAIPTSLARNLIHRCRCELPEGFDCDTDLQVLSPVSSLRDYFVPWLGLKQLPRGRECLNEMVNGAVAHLQDDGIVHAELRNSPFNIADLNGISLRETVDWLVEAAITAEELTGVRVRLVLSLSRYRFDMEKGHALLKAIAQADARDRVVGMDLSGDEDSRIPDEACLLFRKAKDEIGLGVTIHAGETGSWTNIEWAIRDCGADRIGHGLAAIQSQATIELIAERDVCLEVCLHSNLRTGQVRIPESHPVIKFINLGVPFVLCSDNPAVNGTSLSDDYRLFAGLTGREDTLNEMFDRQMRYAFGRHQSGHTSGAVRY